MEHVAVALQEDDQGFQDAISQVRNGGYPLSCFLAGGGFDGTCMEVVNGSVVRFLPKEKTERHVRSEGKNHLIPAAVAG